MNFDLYSSDWTQTNIRFKKLILFAMRMNDSEKTTLKFSLRRVVNMEMFAGVCIKYFHHYESYLSDSPSQLNYLDFLHA